MVRPEKKHWTAETQYIAVQLSTSQYNTVQYYSTAPQYHSTAPQYHSTLQYIPHRESENLESGDLESEN